MNLIKEWSSRLLDAGITASYVGRKDPSVQRPRVNNMVNFYDFKDGTRLYDLEMLGISLNGLDEY